MLKSMLFKLEHPENAPGSITARLGAFVKAMFSSDVQFSNALPDISDNPSSKVTLSNFVQPEKAPSKEVTPAGSVTFVMAVPVKADEPIVSKLSGSDNWVSDEQPLKAAPPIVFTLDGMLTDERAVQPLKA